MPVRLAIDAGATSTALDRRLERFDEARLGARIWERDPTIWFDPPRTEIDDRLGWLDLPFTAEEDLEPIRALAQQATLEGASDIVLAGMGGSSLAPEVFQAVFGPQQGRPKLTVLDTTHPDAVQEVAHRTDPATTWYVIASKSGTTLETMSLFRYLWSVVDALVDAPGSRFIAITDPATPLAALAQERGFRAALPAPPDVGGRFSALSEFGLVPAALVGADPGTLLARARRVAAACGPGVPAVENPGLRLGAALGELALAGSDKLLFHAGAPFESFPTWAEQLIAESLGKDGRGIVPVATGGAAPEGRDRVPFFVTAASEQAPAREGARIELVLDDASDVAGAMFLLEMATAVAGAVLQVHPFDQPDVQLAKQFASDAMRAGGVGLDVEEITLDDDGIAEGLRLVLAGVSDDGYVSIQAYLPPSPATTAALRDLAAVIERATGAVTTIGYGPRFLHSTGQLHKGGPPTGVFLQIVDHPTANIDVPETAYSLGDLIAAQSFGDQAALRSRGRPVLMVCLGDAGAGDLDRLTATTATALG